MPRLQRWLLGTSALLAASLPLLLFPDPVLAAFGIMLGVFITSLAALPRGANLRACLTMLAAWALITGLLMHWQFFRAGSSPMPTPCLPSSSFCFPHCYRPASTSCFAAFGTWPGGDVGQGRRPEQGSLKFLARTACRASAHGSPAGRLPQAPAEKQ